MGFRGSSNNIWKLISNWPKFDEFCILWGVQNIRWLPFFTHGGPKSTLRPKYTPLIQYTHGCQDLTDSPANLGEHLFRVPWESLDSFQCRDEPCREWMEKTILEMNESSGEKLFPTSASPIRQLLCTIKSSWLRIGKWLNQRTNKMCKIVQQGTFADNAMRFESSGQVTKYIRQT